ncbi:MAG: division/cell wall cluster transcriptional repressor MraZ [Clostridiaceae bacterium]|nr:division/cell wall cluster transcriptional repressor MraZ [Clostridiaceae bacterium]
MLLGKGTNTLDPKGRVIIPAAFREGLGFTFYLTRGLDSCLYIYSETEWRNFVERLTTGLPNSKQGNRNAIKHFIHNAVKCEVDKQGRILVPQELREYASLDKDILFIGDVSKVQVWNPELYEDPDVEDVRSTLEEYNIIL